MSSHAGVRYDTSELSNELKRMSVRAESIRMMETFATMLVAELEDEISTEGHGRWPGFAASTRTRGRTGGKLLQDKGILANIQPNSGVEYAEAFSPAKYAKWHVRGTKNMPARDFTNLNLDRVLERIADLWAERAVK